MRIYFATWLEEPSQAIALNNKGALNRLLSYFFLGKRPKINNEIKDYVNANIFCGSSRSNRKRKKMV